MTPALAITIELDEDGLYHLIADDKRMSPTPAGPRLFKAQPHPDIAFTHTTLSAAETDARKLRVYLEWLRTKKS